MCRCPDNMSGNAFIECRILEGKNYTLFYFSKSYVVAIMLYNCFTYTVISSVDRYRYP